MDALVAQVHERADIPAVAVRVAEDPAANELRGLCVIQQRPFRTTADAAYVALIAVARASRGFRLPDGSRLGEFLLGDALREIKQAWEGPPMPAVWAMVGPTNVASHNLFAHWGFDLIPGAAGGYDVRYRPQGVGMSASR